MARVGVAARGPLPDGPLLSFGLAGALARDLAPGLVVTAVRVVDARGETLWAGEPLAVSGARPVTVCAVERVVDAPAERAELAAASGADVADLESGPLAATGRLAGVVRVVSDTPERPLGRLARAVTPAGGTDLRAAALAFVAEPRTALRAVRSGRIALAALARAARELELR